MVPVKWLVVRALGYFDHAATTAVSPAALAAFTAAAERVGNASSLHSYGREARRIVEDAREAVAHSLSAHPSEVIFTSGGTEADNLALKGIFWARRAADPARTRVLISAVEHPAIADTAAWLGEHQGADVVALRVASDGVLDLAALADELAENGERVAVISVMWANHEVGAIQPIADVVALAASHGIPVHSDAVQAVGQVPVNFDASGLAALSVSGHKLGAPVGVGALLARRDLALQGVLHGGGQERGVRSGTLNVPGVAAFAAAITEATSDLGARAAHLRELRDEVIAVVREAAPDAVLQGPNPSVNRLPANANFTFPGCDADSLLFLLDEAGIAASAGAACQAGVSRPSPVLLAMGADEQTARSSVRFTVGTTTTPDDIALLRNALPEVLRKARAAGGW